MGTQTFVHTEEAVELRESPGLVTSMFRAEVPISTPASQPGRARLMHVNIGIL